MGSCNVDESILLSDLVDMLIDNYLSRCTGVSGQCEVRDILSAKVRCTCLRATRGHYRSEAEDGDDGIRLPNGDGLYPEYGLGEKSTEQCKQWPIMSGINLSSRCSI